MKELDFIEKWLYAVPVELLFMSNLDESAEDWENRRNQYMKLLLTFKRLNEEKTHR